MPKWEKTMGTTHMAHLRLGQRRLNSSVCIKQNKDESIIM